MEVGEDVQEDVASADRHRGEELLLVRGEIRMSEHHALGESSRPAGVGQRGQIGEARAYGNGTCLRDEVVEAFHAARRRLSGDREGAHVRQVAPHRVDHRREGLVIEDRARAGIVDLEAHLAIL